MTIRRVASTGFAVTALFASAFVANASADTVAAPMVYVRLVDVNDQTVGTSPWQPLSALLGSLGPYEIGVAVQPTTDVNNRQAVEVDLLSHPGGPPPGGWLGAPYIPFCKLVTGAPGSVQPTGALLYFQGNGVYSVNVSAYTTAQYGARPGNMCSGGPTTSVSLNVAAAASARIAGTPIVPRTTVKARGFAGLQFSAPIGNVGYRYRCARNPLALPDGSVTGSPVISEEQQSTGGSTLQISEKEVFSLPGRWACSVQVLGGDGVGNAFGLRWVRTSTVTVKGQYVRDPTRTSLRRLSGGRVRLIVTGIRQITQAIAGGRLTLTLSRAGCSRTKIVLHRALRVVSRVDRQGRASFTFRAPTRFGFYAGRATFGGGPLMLAGADASDLPFQSLSSVSGRAIFTFVAPQRWAPCG
jgi:hypothetical protein